MAVPESELRDRRPVWSALSELFLDTRLLSADLDRIAKSLAASPYSIEKLEGNPAVGGLSCVPLEHAHPCRRVGRIRPGLA